MSNPAARARRPRSAGPEVRHAGLTLLPVKANRGVGTPALAVAGVEELDLPIRETLEPGGLSPNRIGVSPQVSRHACTRLQVHDQRRVRYHVHGRGIQLTDELEGVSEKPQAGKYRQVLGTVSGLAAHVRATFRNRLPIGGPPVQEPGCGMRAPSGVRDGRERTGVRDHDPSTGSSVLRRQPPEGIGALASPPGRRAL
jgi:hypothetical protein